MSDTQLADQYLYQSSLTSDSPVKVSSRKTVPYVTDINQGSYSSGVITLDATSQLNGAEGFACLRDGYIMLPYKVSMKNIGSGANTTLRSYANRLSLGLKAGVWNVIDGMSVELNGKNLVSMGEYKMFINNLRAQLETSPDYITKHGAENYLFPDSCHSMNWAPSEIYSGDGYSNNQASGFNSLDFSIDSESVIDNNDGFMKRLLCNPPPVSATTFGWPSMLNAVSKNIASQLGTGCFERGADGAAGSVMGTWNYMLKIKLRDLHPIFDQLDLLANPQLKLRLRVNQGTTVVNVTGNARSTGTDPLGTMKLKSTTLQSGTICPIMISSAREKSPNNSILCGPVDTAVDTDVAVSWGIVANALEPTIDGSAFPYTTSRLYVPFVYLENPSAIISKPMKKVRYLDFYSQYFYQRAGLGLNAGQHNVGFDLQLSASLKNAKYVALLPFAETSSGNFEQAHSTQQYQSPFDSAPWTMQPGSAIRNFNVRIGSQQVFPISHDYNYSAFADEFAKLAATNGDITPELSSGLIDMFTWSTTNRVLVADVSRLTEKDVPQSIQIMGTNASSQGVNMIVIVAYENELEYNRLTGEVEAYSAN